MTTPPPGSGTPDVADDATDPFAPSATALRVIAGTGLLLYVGAWVIAAVITLIDGVSGDGAAGSWVTAGTWTLHASLVLGLLALALPQDMLSAAWRGCLVIVQYVTLFFGTFMFALD